MTTFAKPILFLRQAMVEVSPVFLKRIIRESLFEWVQAKQLTPIDRIFKEISTRERLGPREREASGRAIFEIIRHWNDLLPKNFDPQLSPHLHHFDEMLTEVLKNEKLGMKKHLSAKPKFDDDPALHLKKSHPLPDFLFREIVVAENGLTPWHDYLHASLTRAPVFLRLNESLSPLIAQNAKQLIRDLGGVESSFVKNSYRFNTAPSISNSPLGQRGWGEVQDEHSQVVAHLLAPKKSERILDMCAGGGGKTLHLADMLGNEGEVFAYDSDSRRLAALLPRAKKYGWKNIKILTNLSNQQKFDTILIDAPCSGLGTLRRSPDRLFSFTQKEAERLHSVQTQIIMNAKNLLSPNGKILYVTCTPRPHENLQILAPLFAQNKIRPLDLWSYLKSAKGLAGEQLLSKAQQSASYKIAQAYLPNQGVSIPNECFLALGPETSNINLGDQASDTLKGDSFFIALVQ